MLELRAILPQFVMALFLIRGIVVINVFIPLGEWLKMKIKLNAAYSLEDLKRIHRNIIFKKITKIILFILGAFIFWGIVWSLLMIAYVFAPELGIVI